jgi:hypothetical protein
MNVNRRDRLIVKTNINLFCSELSAFWVLLLPRYGVIDPPSRGIPARAGHRPDASPRDTRVPPRLPAAPPHALRASTQTARHPVSCAVTVSLSHSVSPSDHWNGECILSSCCASARRSRHRAAGDPHRDRVRHTGLRVRVTALRLAPRPAPAAQAPSRVPGGATTLTPAESTRSLPV